MSREITVLMDLPDSHPYHRATVAAIDHACSFLDADIDVRVVATDAVDVLGQGVVIGPGSPYRDSLAAEKAIGAARERGIPLVGT